MSGSSLPVRRVGAVALFCTTTACALIAGTGAAGADAPDGRDIVEAAAAQAGEPYSYGADGPGSFDCSGLTQYAHELVGIQIPRTSRAQAADLQEIAQSDKQPGDVVFFENRSGRVYHAGIYAGNGQVWAAPESGDVVRLQDIWTGSYSVGRAW